MLTGKEDTHTHTHTHTHTQKEKKKPGKMAIKLYDWDKPRASRAFGLSHGKKERRNTNKPTKSKSLECKG